MRHNPAPASATQERLTNPDPPATSTLAAPPSTAAAPDPAVAPAPAAAPDPAVAPAPAAATKPATEPKPGVETQLAAALMELDLEAAQRLNRRVGPLKQISFPGQLQDHAATERANRSTLDEMAASLGISRSAMNRILDEPPAHTGGKHAEHKGGAKRHDHGSGRRRHAG